MVTKCPSRKSDPLLVNLLKWMTCCLPCLQGIHYRKSPITLDNIQCIFLQQVELSVFLKQKQANFLTFLRRSDNIGDGTIGTYPKWQTLLHVQ